MESKRHTIPIILIDQKVGYDVLKTLEEVFQIKGVSYFQETEMNQIDSRVYKGLSMELNTPGVRMMFSFWKYTDNMPNSVLESFRIKNIHKMVIFLGLGEGDYVLTNNDELRNKEIGMKIMYAIGRSHFDVKTHGEDIFKRDKDVIVMSHTKTGENPYPSWERAIELLLNINQKAELFGKIDVSDQKREERIRKLLLAIGIILMYSIYGLLYAII